jgi:carbon starvation protein CstA
MNYNQVPVKNRLFVSIPLFAIGFFLTQIDFSIIWRYFAWSNQTLAMIVLWTITVFLVRQRRLYWITLIPAVFMTAVTTTYLLFAPEGFSLSKEISYPIGAFLSVISLIAFFVYKRNYFNKITASGKSETE